MARGWSIRGTTLFTAFVLNSLVAALVSTAIVETRLALNSVEAPGDDQTSNKALITFGVGFLITFGVYNIMYLVLSYGSSLTATKYPIPYW